MLENMWDKLEVAMRLIGKNEKWIDTRWLDRSSLDDQRLRKRRLETKCGNRNDESPCDEVGKIGKLRVDQMFEAEKRYAHQVREAGNYQKEGKCQVDGRMRLEVVHTDAKETEQKLQKKHDEEKVKLSNQVEEIENDSLMFGRRKLLNFERSDNTDEAKENSEDMKNIVDFIDSKKKEDFNAKTSPESSTSRKVTFKSHESGKMNTEMRNNHQRSSASQTLLNRKPSQERSFCGKVKKKMKGGTPQN